MPCPLFHVDAFTHQPGQGNPAAVCLMDVPRSDGWMRMVAAEMNLSETAFARIHENEVELRWFTPTDEVDLCGHATLATAHILWSERYSDAEKPIHFLTRSGRLTARREENIIELNFPAEPAQAAEVPDSLLAGLGIGNADASYVGRNRMDYLVEVSTESILRQLRPQFPQLAQVAARGTIVTARSESPDWDFVSRFFAPQVGVDEDPVTGSAHCCLACHWANRLNKSDFRARQLSARGGEVGVRLEGDRVFLRGTAVTVLSGTLTM